MSESDTVEGEVVAEVYIHHEDQSIEKRYTNCRPTELANEEGRYKLVKVEDH